MLHQIPPWGWNWQRKKSSYWTFPLKFTFSRERECTCAKDIFTTLANHITINDTTDKERAVMGDRRLGVEDTCTCIHGWNNNNSLQFQESTPPSWGRTPCWPATGAGASAPAWCRSPLQCFSVFFSGNEMWT